MERPSRISIVSFSLYSILYLSRVHSFSDCGGVQNRYVCDASNPRAFHICLDGNKHSLVCPGTLHFNAESQICDWPGTTFCPHDNYSGQEEDDVGPDDDLNNDIQYSDYQSPSVSSAAAGKAPPLQIRVNPYEDWHKKEIYHGYGSDGHASATTQRQRHNPRSNRNKYVVNGKRRKVAVYNNNNNNNDVFHGEANDIDEDFVENDAYMNQMTESGGKTSSTAGANRETFGEDLFVRRMNKKRIFVHSYKRKPDDEKPRDFEDLRDARGIHSNNDINVNAEPYNTVRGLRDYMNNLDNERRNEYVDSNDDSFSVPKKLRKGRRRSYNLRRSSDTRDRTIDTNRKRPRSLSPYAPPSEAYNIYSSLKRELNKNRVFGKRQTLTKQRKRTEDSNVQPSTEKKHKEWYQQPSISKALNHRRNIIDSIPINREAANQNHDPVKAWNDRQSEKRDRSHQEARTAPSWINVFIENGSTPTNHEDMIRQYGSRSSNNNGNSRRRHGYRSSNLHRSKPIRHNNISMVSGTSPIHETSNPGISIQARPKTKIRKNQGIHRSSDGVSKYFNQQSKFDQVKSSIGKHRKDSNPEIKRSWTMSEINDSGNPVWHPRIRPYRPWPLSELINDANKLTKNDKSSVQREETESKTIPEPVVSFNGDIIHPYKPKQYGAVEAKEPKSSNVYHYDRKILRASPKNKKRKGKCSSSWCQLPECRCAGSDIPGGLSRDDVPMMVMLTFDDGVNTVNYPLYKQIFDGSLKNPNGCPVKGTFFVSGDNTNYELVKRLSKAGHEIASHTLSHRSPTTWWSHAGVKNWEKEVVGMKNRLAEKSSILHDSIQGMRAPFLQIGGNDQYSMLVNNNFRYDSSMVTGSMYKNSQLPIWPFTLDSPPNHQTCNLPPCPTESYPGLWEIPLIRWYGNNGIACAMADSCYTDHGHKGTFSLLQENFQRHNKSNRAPFGIFIHASWFQRKSENFEALKDFLSSILGKKDVWLLTASQVLDWMEQPIPSSSLDSIKSWQC